jgi:hypothetical protein
MARWFICDARSGRPCIFSEAGWRGKFRNGKGASMVDSSMIRCIRHGALVDGEIEAPDRKAAEAELKRQMGETL